MLATLVLLSSAGAVVRRVPASAALVSPDGTPGGTADDPDRGEGWTPFSMPTDRCNPTSEMVRAMDFSKNSTPGKIAVVLRGEAFRSDSTGIADRISADEDARAVDGDRSTDAAPDEQEMALNSVEALLAELKNASWRPYIFMDAIVKPEVRRRHRNRCRCFRWSMRHCDVAEAAPARPQPPAPSESPRLLPRAASQNQRLILRHKAEKLMKLYLDNYTDEHGVTHKARVSMQPVTHRGGCQVAAWPHAPHPPFPPSERTPPSQVRLSAAPRSGRGRRVSPCARGRL
eukprot:3314683-Prymnesium_polylepis.1